MIVSQQVMILRIQSARKLREAYEASSNLLKDNPKLPEAVKEVLRTGVNSAWDMMNKAERKVIVGVQKKLPSDFSHYVNVFENNVGMWPDDPTLTILPENDIETEEEEND